MTKNERRTVGRSWIKELLGGALFVALFVLVSGGAGFAPAGAAIPAPAELDVAATTCPAYFLSAIGTPDGTTTRAMIYDASESCVAPTFVRGCSDRLFVAEEYSHDSCNPEEWPEYSCSLTINSEPEVLPDDFCDPEAWADDSCGITIHSIAGDVDLPPCVACGITIHSLSDDCPPHGAEARRQAAVHQMLDAFESYRNEHGTYKVADAGFRGSGHGWVFYDSGPGYDTSIASALIEGGHLPAEPLHDDLWDGSPQSRGDVIAYRCKSRVAVFTTEGDGQPSAADAEWWTDNNCFRYPIDDLGATYFSISLVATSETELEVAVHEVVAAFESYGDEHGTYRVDGTGANGTGHGWVFYEGDWGYDNSIAAALVEGGHLPAESLHEYQASGLIDGSGDVLAYRCKSRIAVFTTEGDGQPSADDSAWWAENECPSYVIDTLGATYFSISEPL